MRSSGRRTPTKADLAAALLPAADRTLLLRACVPGGGAPLPSLAALRAPDVRRAALLPSLLHAARVAGTDPEPEVASVLRAARTHEELRTAAIGRAIRETLEGLREPALVVGGVAAAATAYEEWPLRHCHDLDLLVHGRPGAAVHASGFPVVRHVRLYPGRGDDPSWVWERSVEAEVAGVPARTLSPADALAHVLGRAAWGTTTLRWALDAWWTVHRSPGLDWDAVADHAVVARLAAPVALLAGWLAAELDAPIPAGALELLDECASAADPRDTRRVLRGPPRPWTLRRIVVGARAIARGAPLRPPLRGVPPS